jgi:fused signal recognition particle receptor
MFSFFKKKPVEAAPAPEAAHTPEALVAVTPNSVALRADSTPASEQKDSENTPKTEPRKGWMDKLKAGLRKTGSSIATVFTGTQIDDALYEELEAALLMSDAGVAATNHLLVDLKKRVKEAKATEPAAVKTLLSQALADLLAPLQRPLTIGEHKPTVMMIAGVNGAGKTTSIGKLTWHLSGQGASVLLAAADTFRAAAKEQLAVWATRNNVEIVSQANADPAAVAFDAVTAGKARQRDVVMEEIAKIKRVITKAEGTAPHETLLVIDGNTGQNALAQVKAFDEALQITGLIITKLDGTAKGGVLAAIALWAKERQAKKPDTKAVAVYFIGVGEKLEDLETFDAAEFSQALIA